ncbi:hypothetical protein [Enterococcus malodoratus]|uniref:hypothetical protein n=1 Tax=Enterococcus malodoratus TaxID=71451 RepID=UPI00207326F1|nr:hypothetical protein [Enterococcus malodoratus]
MRKIIYCLFTVLLPYPLNANASSHEPIPASIEISYINVTLDGKNINSGVVEVTPGQQLRSTSFSIIMATQLQIIQQHDLDWMLEISKMRSKYYRITLKKSQITKPPKMLSS